MIGFFQRVVRLHFMQVGSVCSRFNFRPALLVFLLSLVVTACGGGSSGSSRSPTPTPTPVPTPSPPTRAQMVDAASFAQQATFGLPYAGIETLAADGKEVWLDRQFALPVEDHLSVAVDFFNRREGGEFDAFEDDIEFLVFARRLAWWHRAITAEDVVRQRVAFALSQIFVVSDNVDELNIYPNALSGYNDVLLRNAFGNFRVLLKEVALHPAMGVFLSHLNNRKADAVANTFPDENFAREVMQLFSIGLFELNPNGTQKTDSANNSIPTYNNQDIREFAKIFTGLSWGGEGATFGKEEPDFSVPMQMFEGEHEPGSKLLLNGQVVPAGQSGDQDIDSAIDNLFQHPNVGPFIGRQLIQRLVTSNPTPAYIERVSNAFANNGNGVRGDMQAVLRAILFDDEAQGVGAPDYFGRVREPVLRYASVLRQFGANSDDGFIAEIGYRLQFLGKQHPFSSPSVFNFYLPDHSPQGALAEQGLVAPELQIMTSAAIINMSNVFDLMFLSETPTEAPEPLASTRLDFSDYVEVAGDVDALLDRLDIVVTAGTLSVETRSVVASILNDIPDIEFRTQMAIYLVLISPDALVQT